jgi:hypothetical protein
MIIQGAPRVNTSTAGQQTLRTVGALADGGYTVGWLSVFSTPPDANGTFTTFDRPFIQRYDNSGVPSGPNIVLPGNDRAMAVLRDGRVVTVCCERQLGPLVEIIVTWLDPSGAFLDLRPVQKRSQVSNISTDPFFTDLKILALADGGFLVSWLDVQPTTLGNSQTLYTQRYDSVGREIGGPLVVAGPILTSSLSYTLSADAQGGYTVLIPDAPALPTRVIHFDANQTRVVISAGRPGAALLLPLAGDRYVFFAQDALGSLRQFLDSAGNPVGNATRIASMPVDARELADGSFVVFSTSSSATFAAERFDSTGAPVGNVLTLQTGGPVPGIAALANGGFAIAWSGPTTPGDLDVFTQRVLLVVPN